MKTGISEWPIWRWFRRYSVLERVIVTTKKGQSFQGVLKMRRRGFLVLRASRMLRERQDPIVLDGDLVILAENIDFYQVV